MDITIMGNNNGIIRTIQREAVKGHSLGLEQHRMTQGK